MELIKHAHLFDGFGNPIKSFNGALDMHDADVHHRLINHYFHDHTSTTTTFAVDAPAGSIQITLLNATGFATGDFLHIQDGATELVHPKITALVGSVATLDRPIDNNYVIGDTITKTVLKMNVLGSLATPRSFKATPDITDIWHIETVTIEMTHPTAGDNGLFGNIAGVAGEGLTNGVVLRVYDAVNQKFTTIANWKTNSDIVVDIGDITYSQRSGGGGSYGTNSTGNVKGNTGSVLYINGTVGDYLEVLIQDDLTELTSFRIKIQGHVEGN